MVAIPSTMVPLGALAPDFSLPDTEGNVVSRDDFDGAPALLVMFLSNHCPYVKHVRSRLAELAREYMAKGVAVVGVNSNDVGAYPDDSPERMAEEKQRVGYPFPYLFDESQQVAKAYRAACTPDFFVFDSHRRLAYRGQMDDATGKRQAGHRRGPATSPRRGARRQISTRRSASEHGLQHQVEAR